MQIVGKSSGYKRANALVYRCDFHLIWCTKYRRPVLTDNITTRLKELIAEKQDQYGYEILELEVMPDHVHLLAGFTPKKSPSGIIGRIKGYTSSTLRGEFPSLGRRLPSLWTRGKFIASTGGVTLEAVKQYVESQKGV